MIKSIAAVIAVVAQLTAWLKAYVDKRAKRDREHRNEAIESDPADKFIDKFGGADGVHNARPDVLPEQANADADTDAAKRDRAE
jgi:hypothetical protein